MEDVKTLATQGIEPNGGGALGSKSVSKLGSKGVRRNFTLAPWGRADLRTDGAKRVRIANRLSGMHVSAKAKLCERGANPRQGVRRTGEGLKVNIAQLVRDDMSIQVSDSETDKRLDCHVADAPRNDIKSNPSQPSLRKGRRIGFTLAEVLITLGIIGVVAALTIPNLIQHYKKQEVVARLKSSESIFSQMLYFSVAQNGDPQNWDLAEHEGASSQTTSSKEIATRITEKYFLSYLKAKKYYGYTSLKEAGYPVYHKADGSLQKWNLDEKDWMSCIIELSNGMTVFLRPDSTVADENGISHFVGILLYIDINGKKGPNVWGRDMFLANIDTKKGKFVWPAPSNSRSYLKDACGGVLATRCGTLIWKDGYEIKDDYPIRL